MTLLCPCCPQSSLQRRIFRRHCLQPRSCKVSGGVGPEAHFFLHTNLSQDFLLLCEGGNVLYYSNGRASSSCFWRDLFFVLNDIAPLPLVLLLQLIMRDVLKNGTFRFKLVINERLHVYYRLFWPHAPGDKAFYRVFPVTNS